MFVKWFIVHTSPAPVKFQGKAFVLMLVPGDISITGNEWTDADACRMADQPCVSGYAVPPADALRVTHHALYGMQPSSWWKLPPTCFAY